MSQPYEPPPPPRDPELGSLTQSVRKKGLGAARGWMIFVGVITILFNLFLMFMFDSMVEAELKKHPGAVLDQEKVEQLRKLHYLVAGGAVLLGITFIVLGILVYKFPIVCTVTGLVLYLGGHAVFAYLEPESLLRGWIFKIIIIAALVKAIQAALAYEREERKQREFGMGAEA